MTKQVLPKREDHLQPFWWRRRVGLAPIYVGAGSSVLAGLSFYLAPGQVAVCTVTLAVLLMALAEKRWGGRKKDTGMRNLAWATIATSAVYIGLVRSSAIPLTWLFVVLVCSVTLLGAFWWCDNHNRYRVKIERDQERWPIIAERLGMKNVMRGPEQKTETGRKWRFWWHRGDYTLQAFRGQQRALEQALGIPENRLRLEYVEVEGMRDSSQVIVTENTQSPALKKPIPFGSPTMAWFTDEMLIGLREDGAQHKVRWFEKSFGGMHTLAAGSSGAGKSGLYHLVLAESAFCPDLVRWGIDAKGGMALRPWASLFDWMVTEEDEYAVMLEALHEILKARSKYAAEQGWQCWKPDAQHPILLLLIDEAAEVLGLANWDNNFADSIARMGRAAGVLLLLATQHPTNEAISSQQLMKNVRRRFCFSVEDGHAQRVIIPKSTEKFDASDIAIGPQHVGTYYSSEGGVIHDLSGRVRYVQDSDVYRIVLQVGDNVAELDQVSVDAANLVAEGAYANRRIWTTDDVIAPEGWKPDLDTDGDEAFNPEIVGGRVDVVPPQAPRPLVAAMEVPKTGTISTVPPLHPAGEDPVGDLGDEPLVPWQGGTHMNLGELVSPRDAGEQAALDQAVAEWNEQFAKGDMSAEQAETLLDKALDSAGPEGTSIAALRRLVPRSTSWLSDKLAQRMRADKAVRLRQGRYARPGRKLTTVSNGHPE